LAIMYLRPMAVAPPPAIGQIREYVKTANERE
jgi:hypothetical protein